MRTARTTLERVDGAARAALPSPRRGVGLVAVGAATVVALQCLRALFPVAYAYQENSGTPRTIAVLLAVFLVPALAPALERWFRPGAVFVTSAVALAAVRLALQAVPNITVTLAAVAAGIGLLALFSGVVAFRHRGPLVAVAVVAGLAVDVMIRGAALTWDVVWRNSWSAWAVTVVTVAVLVTASLVARSYARESRGAIALPGLALGAYLALAVWFLQSPAFVASSGDVALATAVAVVLVADIGALLAIVAVDRAPVPRAAAAAVAVIAAWWLPSATGGGVVVLVVAGTAAASVLLARVLQDKVEPGRHATLRDTVGVALGLLVSGAVVLLYQLHYDRPLPVSNRVLPVVAALVLAVTALLVRTAGESAFASRQVVALAGVVAIAGGIVCAALVVSEPDVRPAMSRLGHLRVVTYNPHETVTRDGQLDPGAFGRQVERLRPDVLVVEEAGRGWQLSAGLDLAEWAKRRLGMPYVWAPAADHQFGNLLFSRVPVHDARVVELPQGGGSMKRSAVIARVGPVAGQLVTVVGTHLQNKSNPTGRAARLAEIRALARVIGNPRRTVLAGDLNSDPGTREVHALLDLGFRTRQPTERCTLTTSNRNCSDWIFVSPDLEQQSLRVVPFDVFDHRPVVAVVRPRPEG